MSPKKVIIDCDTGTDDAQAIMMCLAYPKKVEVVAITCVYGNSSLVDTTRNTLRVLNVCDRLDIPVYAGCSSSLLGEPHKGNGYHGYDSLGDVPDLYPPGDVKVHKEHAVDALVKLTKDSPGEVTLIALGPLTNLATALKLDPNFGRNLKEVCIMGGNTSGKGNITCSAEFNFWNDPEAAQYVLNHLNTPTTLVPLELCEDFSFSWEWYDNFCRIGTKKGEFIRIVEEVMVTNAKKNKLPKYWCWDQLAAAVMIDESVISATKDAFVTVELNGTFTRGQVVVDHGKHMKKPNNVTIITEVDLQKYEAMLFELMK